MHHSIFVIPFRTHFFPEYLKYATKDFNKVSISVDKDLESVNFAASKATNMVQEGLFLFLYQINLVIVISRS